jgi:hypothetical protein
MSGLWSSSTRMRKEILFLLTIFSCLCRQWDQKSTKLNYST